MDIQLLSEIEKKQNDKDFFMEVDMDTCWWASLGKRDLLELAFILSKNALVVWENHHFPDKLKDNFNSIKSLPGKALHEIEYAIDKNNEAINEDSLNDLFTLFVTPVIQFQDGDLHLPYEVKSAFLSVFDILKGMLSTRNEFVGQQCFSSSITRSLDAIKISNVLTYKEISMLTQKYLLLSGKG